MGATRWQMLAGVILPASRQGILTAVILGLGRAVGETMAVQMVIGNITTRIPQNLVPAAPPPCRPRSSHSCPKPPIPRSAAP